MGDVVKLACSDAAAHVRDRLRDHGLAFDAKPFMPHITLARRVRIPRTGLVGLAFPEPCELTRITLFKSTLDPCFCPCFPAVRNSSFYL